MSTYNYNNIEFTKYFIDFTSETEGDGLTPQNCFNNLGAHWKNNAIFFIRRKGYNQSYYSPMNITNNMVLGYPKEDDPEYDMLEENEINAEWLEDEDEYAELRVSGSNQFLFYNTDTQSNYGNSIFKRIYFHRATGNAFDTLFGDDGDSYLKNYNTILFDTCKFESIGYEVSDPTYFDNHSSYPTYLDNNHPNSDYLLTSSNNYTNTNFIMKNTIVSSQYTDANRFFGFRMQYAFKNLFLENIKINSYQANTNTSYSKVTALGYGQFLSFNSCNTIYISNIEQHLIRTDPNYLGSLCLLCLSGAQNSSAIQKVEINNIKATYEEHWTEFNPNQMSLSYINHLLYASALRSYDIENINIDFSALPIQSLGQNIISISNSQGDYPLNNTIKNIKIKFNPNGSRVYSGIISSMISYESVNSYMNSTEHTVVIRDYFTYSMNNPIYENIEIIAPDQTALCLIDTKAKASTLNGTVKLYNSYLDCDTLINQYADNYAIMCNNNDYFTNTININELNINAENRNRVAIYSSSSSANILINYSNYLAFTTAAIRHICNNSAGQFLAYINNNKIDGVSIRRKNTLTEGTLRFNNSNTSTTEKVSTSLVIAPFKGINKIIETTGKKLLTLYLGIQNSIIPNNNYEDKFFITVKVPLIDGTTRMYKSKVMNFKKDTSEWLLDSSILPYKVELPFEVFKANSELEVNIYNGIYSTTGVTYVDPEFEVTDIEE